MSKKLPDNIRPASKAPPSALPEAMLKVLINEGLVKSWVARGRQGGFTLEAVVNEAPERTVMMGSARSGVRTFASIATIALLLRRYDIHQFTVDAKGFEPGRMRAARPDRAEVMKAASALKPAKKPLAGSRK